MKENIKDLFLLAFMMDLIGLYTHAEGELKETIKKDITETFHLLSSELKERIIKDIQARVMLTEICLN